MEEPPWGEVNRTGESRMARWTAGDRGPPGPAGHSSMSTWGTWAHEQCQFPIFRTQRLRIGHCWGSPNCPAQVCGEAQLRALHPGGRCPRTRGPPRREGHAAWPTAGLEAALLLFFFELLSVFSYLGPLNPSARHLSPQSLSAAPDANSTGGNAFKVAPAPMKETSKLREPVLAAHAGWNGPPPPGRSAP